MPFVLRYFENNRLKEVGAALGINDDAAQKRLSRAVEKLRQFFVQRNAEVQYIEDGRLSEPVIALLGGTEQFAMKRFENVSLLVTDSAALHKLERDDPKRIVAQSAAPFSSPDGKWIRFYLLAEGRVVERRHERAEEIWDGIAP